VKTCTLGADFWGASPRLLEGLRAYRNGQTPSSAGRRQGKHRHPAPTRGYRFAAPRGAPALAERLQRSRDPGPASAHGAPGIPRMRLSLSKSTCGPQVRLGNGRCALFQMRGCQVHLAFQGRTWHLQVHLQFSRAHRALSRCTCSPQVHPVNAGRAVRPVSNKRMPGAPGDLQVHLGISRCAWHRLMRTLLVKARLSGRY
jgi:hypothetical protein